MATEIQRLEKKLALAEQRLSNLERAFVALVSGSDETEEETIEARHRSSVLPRALAFMREASEGE